MLGMATVLLLPTIRIQSFEEGLRMSVYADDRNAASPSERALARVEDIWRVVESTTALKNNEEKTKRWHAVRRQGRWRLEG
eukprot:3105266-Alexandrium_andersonii.AAC.1